MLHRLVDVLILVAVLLAHEVLRTFVFVGAAILMLSVLVKVARGGKAHVLEAADGLVDVAGGELVQLLVVAEDDDGYIDLAQHGQFVRLLEQTTLAFEKGSANSVVSLAAHTRQPISEQAHTLIYSGRP